MATYEQDCGDPDGMPSAEEINEMMVCKAHELFGVCDKEEKGFITKRDMQRLQTELPLSPDQLENVFDSLDNDGNGFLTLEEFTGGFGSFLGLTPALEKQDSLCSSHGDEKVYENENEDSEEEQETFTDLLESLDAHGVFEDQEVIKKVWSKIRKEEPELQGSFEEFLSRVTGEIKRSHADLSSLEGALRNKTVSHDEEVRKLYEEMEYQIRCEKDKILAEEKAKERQLREEMEKELVEKERMLSEVLSRQQEMEEKLTSVHSIEGDAKVENEKLLEERKKKKVPTATLR